MPKKKLLVFLSHASEDKPIVKELCQKLKDSGFDPWLDEDRLLPGQDWGLEIEKALHASDVVLLCFSTKSTGKEGYVQREYKRAADIQKEKPEGAIFVIPVRLDNCEVPHFISELQWADYPAHYDRLLKSLQSRDKSNSARKRTKIDKPQNKQNKIEVASIDKVERTFNDMTYRQEVLKKFFGYIKSYESFYLIGGSSVGKTRLFEFLMRSDIQEYYLGNQTKYLWLIRVNPSLLTDTEEPWMFYELLINSLLRTSINHNVSEELKAELARLDSDVIESQNLVKAIRFFDLAVNKLCQVYDIQLCFFFDEFDEAYKHLPHDVFTQLRAIRDANKYRILYILFFRSLPEKLRAPTDNEAFYELISRNVVGIGPYTETDAMKIFVEWERRHNCSFLPEIREKIYLGSAGHQGLAIAMLNITNNSPSANENINDHNWLDWFGKQEYIKEECRKIFDGLDEDEKRSLDLAARGNINNTLPSSIKALTLKGLLKLQEGTYEVFSPLLRNYILSEVTQK